MRLVALVWFVVGACGNDRAPGGGAPDDAEPGVACLDGAEQPCPGGLDVGTCRSGVQRCVAGAWAACEGRVDPVAEACDLADDDCDGVVDGPGASSACSEGSICDEGACAALPRVRWTADLVLNTSSGVSIDQAGTVFLAGDLRFPLAVGGRALAPFDSSSFPPNDVYRGAFDVAGTALWLHRDGTGQNAERVYASSRGRSGDAFAAVGFFYGSTQLAGRTVIEVPPESHDYVAVYGADGAERWMHYTQPRVGITKAIAGAGGVEVGECAWSRRSCVLRRLGPSGAELATVTLDLVSNTAGDEVALRPIAQLADGTARVFGSYQGTITSSCPGLPASGGHAFVASVDASGACAVLQVIDIDGPAFFRDVQPWSTGVVVSSWFTGTITIGGRTVTSPGDESNLLAIDATGLAWSWRTPEVVDGLGVDDLDNVYMLAFHFGHAVAAVRSLRRDGVVRWEHALSGVSYVGPASYLDVNRAGAIAVAAPTTFADQTLHYMLYRIDGR